MTTTTTARTESALAASARRYWSTQSDAKHRSTDEAAYARYADELLAIVPASGTLVDVGCGACEVTAHLAPYFDHVIGFDRYKKRCEEEYHVWVWTIRKMRELGVQPDERVHRRVELSMQYAVGKAMRRGLKELPQSLEQFLPQAA